jgi:hypothetical protein
MSLESQIDVQDLIYLGIIAGQSMHIGIVETARSSWWKVHLQEKAVSAGVKAA